MINSNEITFVIQGPISSYDGRNQNNSVTLKLIHSIRKFYPNSLIVLSSWNNQDEISEYKYIVDHLVLSEDPGSIGENPSWFSNINRQIVSTINGLKHSKTRYSAKIRSDFYFVDYFDFNKYFFAEQNPNSKALLFESKILMCSSKGHYPLYPYYISDWFHFGLTKDLIDLWDVPLATSNDANYYVDNGGFNLLKIPFSYCNEGIRSRFHSEQYIFISFLLKKGINTQVGYKEFGITDLIKSYLLTRRNFLFVSRFHVNLRSHKYNVQNNKDDLLFWNFRFLNFSFLKAITIIIEIILRSYYVYFFRKK